MTKTFEVTYTVYSCFFVTDFKFTKRIQATDQWAAHAETKRQNCLAENIQVKEAA